MSILATDKEKNGALSEGKKSVVFCIIAYFFVIKRIFCVAWEPTTERSALVYRVGAHVLSVEFDGVARFFVQNAAGDTFSVTRGKLIYV